MPVMCDREVGMVSLLVRMLNSDSAYVPTAIVIELGVLVEILRLRDVTGAELDIERVGILKVLDLHGLYERSRNALCTVSPSASNTTRRYRPSSFRIAAQRRIRPST